MIRLWAPLLVASLLMTKPAIACSCGPSSICDDFLRASMVFVGKAESKVVEEQPDALEEAGSEVGPRFAHVTVSFHVLETLRGAATGVVEVETTKICGYPFEVGKLYLVFAHQQSDGRLITGICSGTHAVSSDDVVVQQLRALSETGRTAALFGKIVRYVSTGDTRFYQRFEPLAGIRIWAAGPRGDTEAVTDGEGGYVLDLAPGEYNVSLDLPPRLALEKWETGVVEIGPIGCRLRDFNVFTDGRISGQVIRPDGRPARGYVHLVPAGLDSQAALEWEERTGGEPLKEGTFEFRQLPPHKYTLFYRELDLPEQEYAIYYPGVIAYDKAREIFLGEGEHRTDVVFQLPPPELVLPPEDLSGMYSPPEKR